MPTFVNRLLIVRLIFREVTEGPENPKPPILVSYIPARDKRVIIGFGISLVPRAKISDT